MSFVKAKEDKECPNPFEDKVKCEECKCWLDKSDAAGVEVFSDLYGYRDTEWYCLAHQKPYNELNLPRDLEKPVRYFGRVEMTEKGVPLKRP